MTNFNTYLTESERAKSLIEGDSEARELEIFIENDSELYHRQLLPIIKNIKRKMRRGKYDHSLAPKLWSYLVDNGAKKYAREFSTGESDWNMIFDKRTRIQVAQSLADDYADAITNGEYGALDESVRIDESRKMNYDQFVKHFETNILPLVKRQYEKDGKVDKPARREAFNDEMDALDRDGMLQGDTYNWDGLPDRLEESDSDLNESKIHTPKEIEGAGYKEVEKDTHPSAGVAVVQKIAQKNGIEASKIRLFKIGEHEWKAYVKS